MRNYRRKANIPDGNVRMVMLRIKKRVGLVPIKLVQPAGPFRMLISHPGVGIFFIDLPEDDREDLDRFIRKYC